MANDNSQNSSNPAGPASQNQQQNQSLNQGQQPYAQNVPPQQQGGPQQPYQQPYVVVQKKSSSLPIVIIVLLAGIPVVIAVLGILAAIAIPAYSDYMKKSREAEALMNLADIRTAQIAFKDDPTKGNGSFARNLDELGWTADTGTTVGRAPAEYAFFTNGMGDAWAETPYPDTVIHTKIILTIDGTLSYN